MTSRNSTHFSIDDISKNDIREIEAFNRYDVKLYKFAEKLFFKRLSYAVTYDKEHDVEVPQEVKDSLLKFQSRTK